MLRVHEGSCAADIPDESTPACSAVVGSWDMSSTIGGMATSNGIKSNVVSPKKKAKSKVGKCKIKNNVDESVRGSLQPLAASMLMRVLYGARYARFDFLKIISRLASCISYWDLDCGKRLMRLMEYVKSSLSQRMVGWVGNALHEVQPHVYADADFAGCPRTLRSTSGAQIHIEGSCTRFPLFARSIRCLLHS